MFIKLTEINGKNIWLNVLNIETITDEKTYSYIMFRGDGYPLEVKESPKQITEMIKEMKK